MEQFLLAANSLASQFRDGIHRYACPRVLTLTPRSGAGIEKNTYLAYVFLRCRPVTWLYRDR
jgi:hypothetical protein